MNQSEALRTINSIQQGYRAIINELCVYDDHSTLRKYDLLELRLFVAKKLYGDLSKVDTGNGISVFERKLNEIAHNVHEFWLSNGELLAAALRTINAYKISTSVPSLALGNFGKNIRRLGVYFDSITVACPIHEAKLRLESRYSGEPSVGDDFEMYHKSSIATNLVTLVLTESLMSLDTYSPIIVVVPDYYMGMDEAPNLDKHLMDSVFEYLIGTNLDGCSDPKERREAYLSAYQSKDEFRSVFDEIIAGQYTLELPEPIRMDWLKRANFDQKLLEFIKSFCNEQSLFNSLNLISSKTLSDPLVSSRSRLSYQSYLNSAATVACREYALDNKGSFAANGLLSDDMDFLEALSYEDLRVIRAEGMIETLREQLRGAREKFRNADYSDLDLMSDSFTQEFIQVISQSGEEHKAQLKSVNKSISKHAVRLAGAFVVGAATIALPQSVLLTAMGLAYPAMVGGSAPELIKAIKEKKDTKLGYKNNPLGVFFRALKAR
ncbi:MAG: hypothetical protein AAGH40_14310 [Verrucomicrobiota bacterium]